MCYLEVIKRPKIYIDYESNMAGHIYMLGYLIDQDFQQIIMDSGLSGLAERLGTEVLDPVSGTIELLKKAVEINAVIVAYSEAELTTFQALKKHTDISIFKDLPYLNLRKAAKKWINQYQSRKFNALPPFRQNVRPPFRERQMKNSLASIMRLTEFHADSDYAPGKTTTRFNTIRKALINKDQNYEALTAGQKRKGTQGLKHNEFDVRALKVLFETIAAEDKACFKSSLQPCFG